MAEKDNDTLSIGGNGQGPGIGILDLLESPEMPAEMADQPITEASEASDNGDESPPAQPVVQEQMTDKPLVNPKTMYLVTRRGITILHNPKHIRELAGEMSEQGINKFIIFRNRIPTYIPVMDDDGSINPLGSPDEIKTTSTRLYAMAVTYRNAITRMVRRHLLKSGEQMTKTSKMVWVIGLSVITLAIIFMLGVVAMDNFGSSGNSESPPVQQNNQTDINKPTPNFELTPAPTTPVTQQDDPSRVYIPPAGANQ